jgi:Dyp-type peroxidase family
VHVHELASQLGDIQGNILPGFNKDHQTFVFLSFGEVASAKRWLADLVDDVASSTEVAAFNDLFKTVGRRHHGREGVVEATWLNVAFTHGGLERLDAVDVAAFPSDFTEGPVRRAREIGDQGASDPQRWIEPFRPAGDEVHALLLLASDSDQRLEREVVQRIADATRHDIRVVGLQEGRVRADLPGREHFGFRDGISQPGVKGYTPAAAATPNQGDPGQDLVFPGEFLLGYPRMRRPPAAARSTRCPKGPATTRRANFSEGGAVAASGPEWTVNGSYLVFRRLRQDVPAFHRFTAELAQRAGISAELAGAKIVGRYPSGAPLERIEDLEATVDTEAEDPSIADPSILGRDRINDFEFADDADGALVPRAAHIRKTYPRDEATPGGGEADTQTHRILRRGIPFGQPYDPVKAAGTDDGTFPNDRGLLFLCYQASIADQFEFVQRCFVNNRDFPLPGDGVDPVISQTDGVRDFAIPGAPTPGSCAAPALVTTTGGMYLFQPSISALATLAGA